MSELPNITRCSLAAAAFLPLTTLAPQLGDPLGGHANSSRPLFAVYLPFVSCGCAQRRQQVYRVIMQEMATNSRPAQQAPI